MTTLYKDNFCDEFVQINKIIAAKMWKDYSVGMGSPYFIRMYLMSGHTLEWYYATEEERNDKFKEIIDYLQK